MPLAQELRHQGTTWVLSMTNRDLPLLEGAGRIPRDTLLIRRILSLHRDSLFEILTIRNFSGTSQQLRLEHWAGARFEDLFEVRGMTRQARGKLLPPEERSPRHDIFHYEGRDGRHRSTHLQRCYDTDKIRLSPYLTGYSTLLTLDPKEIIVFRTVVSFDDAVPLRYHENDFEGLDPSQMMALATRNEAKPKLFSFSLETDHALFNRAIDCASTDIRMLLTEESGGLLYPYAGVPWFSAPFGRDGLITAYQLLPWAPEVARGVLDFVFQNLGERQDPFTDEEPGKAFHELRRGEMALLREIPFVPYFGSVDATPLSLILLQEYWLWTEDHDSLERWWPSVLKALNWLDQATGQNSWGFLAYSRKTPAGLSNQGWKDSHDSIMHDDGRLAEAPIALCEAQAYCYRARMGIAEIARSRGDSILASQLELHAYRLRAEFHEKFWDSERRFVALALDGQGKACQVRSSNMGHCLFGGIVTDVQAQAIAEALLTESFFSGHGIRTLADSETAYNPMSYHNGSIWPHDNALIADGLRRYGKVQALVQLADGMTSVLESSDDYRLPELFCGFRKRGTEPPIPYEVACKPQAWSAGSIFLLLKALLGIEKKSQQPGLVIRNPILPSLLNSIEIRDLKILDTTMNLRFDRTGRGVR
ncbi:MAG: hypothetical protein RJB38_1363, partial [Pseudomonadota bacterium]